MTELTSMTMLDIPTTNTPLALSHNILVKEGHHLYTGDCYFNHCLCISSESQAKNMIGTLGGFAVS